MLNRGYAYTTIINSKYQGQTLLSHLASLYPHSTPQAWQQKLNNGEVTLNGVTATGSESVTLGQTLVWNRPPWIEPDSPQHFEVLFEDPHLLAVNKPSGLPTLPGGGFMENTLLRLVQKQTPNANPVHRLGRATTGIVLFAKTPQAASNLFANWNTPKIQKIYRALAQNIAQHDAYEILTPIGLVPHPLIGSVWAANPSGKPSKSLAKVISRTTSTTTFEVSLNSGRPHQIRIHLASIGHPLVGDPLYGLTGQPLENLPGLPGDGGYFLHAQFLKFHHPITGEQINLEAALPAGFHCISRFTAGIKPRHGQRHRAIGKLFSCVVPVFKQNRSDNVEPFPESVVAPTGFALEGQRDAKRVYEKTESGRARDARQELHNSERPAASPR
jgi:23S rRNA pseudouridine1911/1915/1917 synthase